jgi:uncharacterized protein
VTSASIHPGGEPAQHPPIVDGHCHVASIRYLPMSFVRGAAENAILALHAQGARISRTRMIEMYLAKLQDPHCDELIAEMDAAGIERAVLLLPDFTAALRDCELTIAEMFAEHRAILDRHPGRFYVLAGVDPRWGDDGVRLFEQGIVEHGFHGLKLYPPCGYSPSDRRLYPYYEICAARGLPVLTHVGATSPVLAFDTGDPMLVDQAAREFPGVRFILAHASTAFTDRCVMLARHRPNVYLDVSGYEAAPPSSLRQLLECGIGHKIIFGTDWPVFRMQGRQEHFVQAVLEPDGPAAVLRPAERARFLAATILSLLPERGGVKHEQAR